MKQEQTIAQALSTAIGARKRCLETGNDYAGAWLVRIKSLVDELPHGSGIDGDNSIDLDKSTDEKLVLHGSYHAMNSDGYYDGWSDFTITVRPCFAGIDVRATGDFPRRYSDTRDYLAETFHDALTQPAPENVPVAAKA